MKRPVVDVGLSMFAAPSPPSAAQQREQAEAAEKRGAGLGNDDELQAAFKRGDLEKDFIAVVRFQGPKACGMPELHKLTPPLGVLQDRGFKVALLTDGRMSGASGKIPAAIHMTPEALDNGPIALIRDGDMIELDAEAGTLQLLVSEEELNSRQPAQCDLSAVHYGMGRELFAPLRATVGLAEEGATVFNW